MNRPLLLDFSVPRVGENHTCYSYDKDLDMNIVKLEGKKIPFISYDSNEAELLTKTEVKPEQDDDMINCLELTTKTRVRREQDDESFNIALELLTWSSKNGHFS
jgi:hypothetical protein